MFSGKIVNILPFLFLFFESWLTVDASSASLITKKNAHSIQTYMLIYKYHKLYMFKICQTTNVATAVQQMNSQSLF